MGNLKKFNDFVNHLNNIEEIKSDIQSEEINPITPILDEKFTEKNIIDNISSNIEDIIMDDITDELPEISNTSVTKIDTITDIFNTDDELIQHRISYIQQYGIPSEFWEENDYEENIIDDIPEEILGVSFIPVDIPKPNEDTDIYKEDDDDDDI